MRTQTIRNWWYCILISGCILCLMRSLPVCAQRLLYNSTFDRLKVPIHLALGETTAGKAVTALSAQTGLKIEVAAYLQDRILDVELDNVSGKAALNAIAELNEWKWEEIGMGHIILRRRVPPVPQQLVEVPAAMVAALPKDWRTYLYIDVPWQEAMRASGTTSTQFRPSEVRGALGVRIKRLMNRQLEAIVGSLQPPLGPDSKYSYAKLTPAQRDSVIMILFLRAMNETNHDLLHNRLAPYQLDFTRATIEIRGNDLLIGTHTQQGEDSHFDFFGIQIVRQYALPE